MKRNLRVVLAWMAMIAMMILHHDFLFWETVDPLLFGWMPVGLWYHILYPFLNMVVLYLFVRWAWKDEPGEETEPEMDAGEHSRSQPALEEAS